MEIRLLWQDSALLVCLKPPGLSSEEGLPEQLRLQCGGQIYCVHRLDKPVGGVMVYARNPRAAAELSAQVAARGLEKDYLAVVSGVPEQESAVLRDLLFHDKSKNKSYVVRRPRRGVREAELSYRLLQTVQTEQGALSLLRVRLTTGRSHQIRVQFASRGLPLAGDRRYGSAVPGEIALFACRLAFSHPETGERLCFTAEAPEGLPADVYTIPYALARLAERKEGRRC